ncbi:transmembrane protein, putative (macronuclear) [Tetrahymena thermophila SB210]|uniref:Transmembrane protein, putative n=1 Tax=Tetrahymena thermophila (strain SB210) TaxID=312017 RepID=I7M6J3_TETTS|nr:transmembrane protein, putative [Tetrahymena thermophila SB210]EAR85312.2 transmembrane protein, putative [Tetrahymena thermophila SB210]|eukprot:XP_001032975.2 transmembrane protein, putative [Tetrahymena thermophila SB210]
MIIKEYYINQFYITFHSVKRNTLFAIVLLFFYLLCLIFLLAAQGVIDRIQKNDKQSFNEIRDSLYLDKTYGVWKSVIFVASISYNFVFFLAFLVDLATYKFKKQYKTEGIFMNIVSFLCKIYMNVIFIPSLWGSMINLPSPLAFINLIFTIFFGIAIELHDFDYCLFSNTSDKLSRIQLNSASVFKILIQVVLAFNNAVLQLDAQDFLCFLYICFSIACTLKYREYISFQIRNFKLMTEIAYLIVVTLAILLRSNLERVSFIFLMMSFSGFGYKFVQQNHKIQTNFEEGYIKLNEWIEQKNQNKILFYIQNVCKQLERFNSIDYFLNPYSYILETIASDHIIYCSNQKRCFCQFSQDVNLKDLSLKSQTKAQSVLESKFDDYINRKFLLTHIDQCFLQMKSWNIKNKTINNIDFYYINFLIEQCGIRANVLYQIELIKSQISTQSIFFQLYINYLVEKSKSNFEELDKRTNQLVLGLIFEETLLNAQEQFEKCVVLKLKLMSLLNTDFVDINEFQKFAINLFYMRISFKKKLQTLAKINYQNQNLKQLISLYLDILAFIDTQKSIIDKSKNHKEKAKASKIKKQNSGQYEQKSKIESRLSSYSNKSNIYDPFDKNVCAFFLKVRNSELGLIWRVQESFTSIYGFKNPLNQNINLIIPNSIHTLHNQKMKNFVSQIGLNNEQIIKLSFSIAATSQGFGLPIQLEVSVDHVSHFNEIGLVVITRVIDSEYHYLLLENKERHIKTNLTTKDFFELYLEQHYKLSEVSQLDICKIIPLLSYQYYLKNNDNQLKQTIAFLPSKNAEGQQARNYFKNKTSKLQKQDNLDLDVYSNNPDFEAFLIDFKLVRFSSSDFKSCILQINKFQKIRKQKDIQYELSLLREEVDKLLSNQGFQQEFNSEAYEQCFNKSFREQSKQENLQTFTKHTNQILSSERLFSNCLLSPNSTAINDTKRSMSQTSNVDYFLSANFKKTQFLKQQSDKSQDDATLSTQRIELQPNSIIQIPQSKISQTSKHVNSINQLLGFEEPTLKQDIFNQKIEEKDVNDESSGFNLEIKNVQSIRQKKATLETQSFAKDFNNSFQLGHLTARDHLNQNNSILTNPNQKSIHPFNNENIYIEYADIKSSPAIAQTQIQEMMQESDDQQNQQKRHNYLKQTTQGGDTTGRNYKQQQSGQQIDYVSSDNGNSSFQASKIKNSTKIRAAQSSIQSSQSSTQEALKTVEKKIMSIKTSFGLQILNLFGSLSVLLIVSMIIIQYISIQNAFSKAITDYQFVQWPMETSSETTLIKYSIQMILIFQQQLFPNFNSQWISLEKDNMQQIKQLSVSTYNLFRSQMDSNYDYSPYFLQITKDRITFINMQDYYSFPIKQYNITTGKSTFIQQYMSAHNSYYQFPDDYTNQAAIITDNYNLYKNLMDDLNVIIIDSSTKSLDSIQQNVQLLMILSITLSFSMVFLIIPINAYIQTQREEVLRLFSTISYTNIMKIASPSLIFLQSMTQTTFSKGINSKNVQNKRQDSIKRQSQSQVRNTAQLNKKRNEFLINQTAKEIICRNLEISQKKKNTSLTNSLPKVTLKICLGLCVLFVIIITIPIINQILAQNFKDEQKVTINFIHSLFNLKNSLCESIYFTYATIYSNFKLQQGALYNSQVFEQMAPQILNLAENNLQDFSAKVSDSQQQTRYGQIDYEKFFYPVLQQDICQTLKANPNFSQNTKYNINLSICDQQQNFILKKGLQTASKYYITQLNSAFQTSVSADQANYYKIMQSWQTDFDIKNFDSFFKFMTSVINSLSDFITQKGNSYINQMQLTEIILTVLQISILVIVYYFGWITFYYRTQFEMNQTRRLLSLIDIQIIMDNSYMLSYLNKIK